MSPLDVGASPLFGPSPQLAQVVSRSRVQRTTGALDQRGRVVVVNAKAPVWAQGTGRSCPRDGLRLRALQRRQPSRHRLAIRRSDPADHPRNRLIVGYGGGKETAAVYVGVNGQWVIAQPYVGDGGTWKLVSSTP